MNYSDHWNSKLTRQYATADWSDKPSIFAQWARQYFPTSGQLLELGSGLGQDGRYFAGLGYDVTALDIAEQAIALNRQKATAAKLNINFKVADISNPLTFNDDTFEVVYSHLALHYFYESTTRLLFAEIWRILKPNGILAAIVNSTADPELTQGNKLEDNFVEVGGFQKRFFNPQSFTNFARGFEVLVSDQNGATYKDPIELVRYVGRKVKLP